MNSLHNEIKSPGMGHIDVFEPFSINEDEAFQNEDNKEGGSTGPIFNLLAKSNHCE